MLDHRVHTFLEVCRQGSFTKAAEALRITQPAVSQHVKQLETRFRTKLFTQRGRRLSLPPAGETLFQLSLSLANNEREIERAMVEASQDEQSLAFGATLTVADYAMPPCIAAHRQAFPKEHLAMTVANTQELLDRIDRGELACALVEGYFDERRYRSLPFSRERYVAVCAASSQLPERPRSVRDLLGQPLLLREQGSGTREVLERELATRNLSVESFASTCELGSIGAIKECAAAGLGVTFLYRTAVRREIESGALRDVTPDDFRSEHDFAFVWQRGSMQEERYRSVFELWTKAYREAAAVEQP